MLKLLSKGTKVDGVYNDDPVKNPSAIKYDFLSFDKVLENNLRVMDLTAITLCKENNIPIQVFNIKEKGALKKLIWVVKLEH